MKKTFLLFLLFLLNFSATQIGSIEKSIKEKDITLFDKKRNREIPVTLYLPEHTKNAPLAIISHGYSQNQLGANKGYSFIGKSLAAKGYFVASIQHELPTDELMPTTGEIKIVRKPFWERGSENILYVINDFRKRYPKLNFNKNTIIGHSMGGDISVTFSIKHPELVDKLITLDQRRVAFPRVKQPKIYSLRSSDQPADEDVIPSETEQKELGITIVKLPNTIHNVMNDHASAEQKKEMLSWISKFITE
ncbi:alpha/beta hydrolase [Flavobacterium amniphilum]|uniref:alpha/beta fold hydrolase n=1 Tax=Flavobacterium amniphilum TaxID=1834035 RepID=UPI002029C1F0|nr:alpha/beta fold hydrolase [Flavobacterium amniphilum]MCL9804968.1 alpha/beta hydrolase [Flavobacterium amniphilum]